MQRSAFVCFANFLVSLSGSNSGLIVSDVSLLVCHCQFSFEVHYLVSSTMEFILKAQCVALSCGVTVIDF